MSQKRKVPQRKCIVTNEMKPKEDLIRIVLNKDGLIFVDPTGKQNGRGAYVSKEVSIIEKAEKTGALNKQFKTKVDTKIYEQLKQLISGQANEK